MYSISDTLAPIRINPKESVNNTLSSLLSIILLLHSFRYIATGSENGFLHIYDLRKNDLIQSHNLEFVDKNIRVTDVAFSNTKA